MGKTNLFKTMTIAFTMMTGLSFASCGDDNDGPDDTDAGKAIVETKGTFRIDSTDDFLSFYDITVTFGAGTGAGTTETVSATLWGKTFQFTSAPLPSRYFCNAVAKLKANHPAIDPSKTYSMGCKATYVVSGVQKSGATISIGSASPGVNTKPVSASHMVDFFNKYPEISLDFSCNLPD